MKIRFLSVGAAVAAGLMSAFTLFAASGADATGTAVRPPLWASERDVREDPAKYWNFEELKAAPAWRECPDADSQVPGMKALLVSGASTTDGKGAPAEFFAYYGVPAGTPPPGGWPAVLLVHGGGGTAYPNFVRLWNERGFAVLAPDWYGRRPVPASASGDSAEPKMKHVYLPGFRQVANPQRDHVAVVANLVRAHSLLLSMPEVNPGKTIFAGLSWGSMYGACVGAVDPRLKGVIEIYCGMKSAGQPVMSPLPRGYGIIRGQFLHAAKCPYYWICGTNDIHAEPDEMNASFAEVPRLENKTLVVRLPHGHVGFTFEACLRMAEHFLKGAPNLPVLGVPEVKDGRLRAKLLDPGAGVRTAVLSYTCENGGAPSELLRWETAPAEIRDGWVVAEIPEKAKQAFLSACEDDTRWHEVCGSTPFVTLDGARYRIGSPGRCAVGEKVTFTVGVAAKDGAPVASGRCRAIVDDFGTNVMADVVVDLSKENPFTVSGAMTRPGFLRVRVSDPDDGKAPGGIWSVPCAPERIRPGAACPDDFEAFWREALAKYDREVPEDFNLVRDESCSTAAYDMYRLDFAAPGGRRMHGLLTVPKNRSRGPFRTRFYIPGAGPSTSYTSGSADEVFLQVNVHFYEPVIGAKEHDPAAEARQEVENAEWRARFPAAKAKAGYAVLGLGSSREDYFYYPVILGMQRAVNWLYRQPYVDRTRFHYAGSSQGGGLGLATVALFGRFTSARIGVPALCDHLGVFVDGRQAGWCNLVNAQLPENRERAKRNAPYFDGCNFATLIRTPIAMNVHFCDTCCAPHTQYAAYNMIPSKDKKVFGVAGRGHAGPPAKIAERMDAFCSQCEKGKGAGE